MSTSTDAMFFYGILLNEGWEMPEEWDGEVPRELEHLGVEVHYHCSDPCPMPYLAICETYEVAWRGYPVHLSKLFENPPEQKTYLLWNQNLKTFCETVGIKKKYIDSAPGWYLASWWG